MKAMAGAVESLEGASAKVDFVLVDGNRVPEPLCGRAEAVIKGDAKCVAIAAASIVAKVERDRIMRLEHEKYPEYEFETHKGYGTKAHMDAIRKHGPCAIHRRTFQPIKGMLEAAEQE